MCYYCIVYTTVELGADSNQLISYVLILPYHQHRRRHNYYLYYLETISVGSILASEYYIISPSWASEEKNAGGHVILNQRLSQRAVQPCFARPVF